MMSSRQLRGATAVAMVLLAALAVTCEGTEPTAARPGPAQLRRIAIQALVG